MNRLLTREYEEEILQLIDNQGSYTRSDLQGAVTAIVSSIVGASARLLFDMMAKDMKAMLLVALQSQKKTLEALRTLGDGPDEIAAIAKSLSAIDLLLEKIEPPENRE